MVPVRNFLNRKAHGFDEYLELVCGTKLPLPLHAWIQLSVRVYYRNEHPITPTRMDSTDTQWVIAPVLPHYPCAHGFNHFPGTIARRAAPLPLRAWIQQSSFLPHAAENPITPTRTDSTDCRQKLEATDAHYPYAHGFNTNI